MKRFFSNIHLLILISSLGLSTYAATCDELQTEIRNIHSEQDKLKKSQEATDKSLADLKKERDAKLAHLIALKSLKNIRARYDEFQKEADKLDIVNAFDEDTQNALQDLERHTQAVVTYGVIHSTVATLMKKHADSIAANAKEDNPFVRLFNHLRNGDGKDLVSYMKSACDKPSEDVQSECDVFNDFTKNFENNPTYSQDFTTAINNYGVIMQKIYSGVATEEDAEDYLAQQLEILSQPSDDIDISLSMTANNRPSVDINHTVDSLNLLSSNTQLRDYYKNTIIKLTESVQDHNEDKTILEGSIASSIYKYFDKQIEDNSLQTLSDTLNKLKNCRGKLTKCDDFGDVQQFAARLNESISNVDPSKMVNPANVTIDLHSDENWKKAKDNAIADIISFSDRAKKELETLKETSGSEFNFDELVSEKMLELCPSSTGSDTTQKLLACVESFENSSKINDKVAENERELVAIENQIAEIFKSQPMRDLEIIKALVLRDYKSSCGAKFEEVEVSCMPNLDSGNEGIKALLLAGEEIGEKLLTEDYSRYFYGSNQTTDEGNSKKYLEKFCPTSSHIVCETGLIANGEYADDQYPQACRSLRIRMCNQKHVTQVRATSSLGRGEFYDWDPLERRMVKKKERREFWPQVAMYAAENSYAFMGPMIATQQLRARLPGMVYTGMAQQQALAYQEQYYDWYTQQMDLTNPNLFNYYGGSVYYGSNFGYSF